MNLKRGSSKLKEFEYSGLTRERRSFSKTTMLRKQYDFHAQVSSGDYCVEIHLLFLLIGGREDRTRRSLVGSYDPYRNGSTAWSSDVVKSGFATNGALRHQESCCTSQNGTAIYWLRTRKCYTATIIQGRKLLRWYSSFCSIKGRG